MPGANTEALIKMAVDKFCAPRPMKFISVPGVPMMHSRVHQDGEMFLLLPDGSKVKVTTDASGQVTHVEEDEHQHAIVRPATHSMRIVRH